MYYKACTSTTLYCKNCTKYFPVLLCTTRLAQSNSQYYLVLQSSQKAFPILLCTTKLAQSTSQYYFVLQVLQSLHKALPSTTLYCKTCTEHFPVLLTVSQGTSEHTSSLYTRQAFTHRIFYTKKAFTRRNFYTRLAFTHGIPSFYTKKGLHRSTFLRRKAFTHSLQQAFTHGKLLHREAFTQRSFDTRKAFTHSKILHSKHRKLLHTARFYAQHGFAQRSFYTQQAFTQKPLETDAFTHGSFYYTEKRLNTEALTYRTFYVSICAKHLPLLLCTTKLAQSTSRYYFVLEAWTKYFVLQSSQKKNFPALSLHKALLSTTLYYKACRNHFPVLLCTTKLAETTSQYYFVLQSLHQYYFVLQKLHKVLPGTTLYYKTCTKQFPVLPCTTKLAKSISNSTLYYKACTKYFPVLFCTTSTTKLAQSTSQYYFVLQNLHRALPSTTHSFARYFRTHIKPLHTASFYAQNLLHKESFYTEKLLHTASFYTRHTQLLHKEGFTQKHVFTQKSFYTQLAASFYTRQAFAQRSVYTEICTQRSLYTQRSFYTQRNFYIQKALRTASIFTQKPSLCNIHTAIRLRFAAPRHKPVCIYAHGNKTWQQSCSHSIAICNYRFQNTLQLRTHEQPHVAEHPGGTKKRQNERTCNGLTHELPFIAGKTMSRAPASSPKPSPCNIHAATTMRFLQRDVTNPHVSTHIATPLPQVTASHM